jgi:hypothetical protein
MFLKTFSPIFNSPIPTGGVGLFAWRAMLRRDQEMSHGKLMAEASVKMENLVQLPATVQYWRSSIFCEEGDVTMWPRDVMGNVLENL